MKGGGDLRAELRDECLRQEVFYSLKEAQIVIGLWQTTYNGRVANAVRPK